MTIARLTAQDASGNTSVTVGHTQLAYPGSTTPGNLLVAAYESAANAANALTLANWNQIGATLGINSTAGSLAMFYKIADGTEGGSVVDVTQTGAGTGGQMHLYEYAGAANPANVETSNTHADGATSGTNVVTGTITTVDPGDLVIVAAAQSGGPNGGGTSWTTATILKANTTNRLIVGQYLPAAALSGFQDTAAWTTSRPKGAMIAAFKPARGLLAFC